MKGIAYLLLVVFMFLSSTSSTSFAQMEERINTGNYLEIDGKILHGAGQAGITGFDGFEHYWNCAPNDKKPMLFMDYFDTYHIKEHWSKEIKEELLKYHRQGYYVIPQLGLNITYLYTDIIDGKHEKELDNLVKGFQYLGIPAYVRIGYEFNNAKSWSPDQYCKAFQIITQKFRDANLEIATVWNVCLHNAINKEFYPGDEYVDWVGFNTFSNLGNGQNGHMFQMIDVALTQKKPIMIGEASPERVNDPGLSMNWSWYGVYFGVIEAQATIKAMTYINWDWDIQDMVGGNIGFPWGDARLEKPGSVKDRFFGKMADDAYLHATSEKNFRSLLGYNDNEVPEPVINLKREGDYLIWDAAQDQGSAGLAHYSIYKNGELWDYLIDRKYHIHDLGLGKNIKVYVTAVDRAGNEGEKSNEVTIEAINSIERIIDGGFDELKTSLALDWTFRSTNDGGALAPDDFTRDTTSKLTGKYSALLQWQKTPANPKDWKLQFMQAVNVQSGTEYVITFKAVASELIKPRLYFMSHHIDKLATHFAAGNDYKFEQEWHKYNKWDFEINTTPQTYSYTCVPDKTELGRLSFCFGHCSPVDVWLDDISVVEGGPVSIHKENLESDNRILNFRIIKNPGNAMSTISFQLPEKSKVNIGMYSLSGKLIKEITNEVKNKGQHLIQWNANGISPGIYLFKIKACQSLGFTKCLIVQ